jgi:ketosteroid isomerase-like protein
MTMTDENLRKAMEALVHKDAIRDQLYRYSRAVNRGDIDLLNQVFHPDAPVDYGLYKGPAGHQMLYTIEEDEACKSKFGGLKHAHHLLGNILIELNGDTAKVETYVYASYEVEQEDGSDDMAVWGRYIDRFERRNGAWKIARRHALFDGARIGKTNVDWDTGMFAVMRDNLGSMDKNDPLYSFS